MPFILDFLEPFQEAYKKLPGPIGKAAQKVIRLLSENPRHTSLQTHKVSGVIGDYGGPVFEAYVTMKYRLTWEYGPEQDTITLRNIDNHDQCLKNP